MAKWIGRLSRLALVGLITASMAPGCDGDAASDHSCQDATQACDVACAGDADCSALGERSACRGGYCRLPATELTDNSAGASADAGVETSADAGGAGGTSADGGGDAGEAPSGNCQADPDPTPELLPNAQLDADVIARAAAVLASCWSDDGVPRVAGELWGANLAARRPYYLNVTQARCLADARCGCDAIAHCLGATVETGVAPGCQSSCNGEVFRACGESADLIDGYAINTDCSRVGLHCQVDGCADHVAVACELSDPPVCPAEGPPLFCENGALSEGPNCAGLGLGCANGQCQGTGAACSSDPFPSERIVTFEGISCQGGTLDACVVGQRATLACAEQGPGFDCQSVDGVPFCGLASECLPAELDESYPMGTCDGTRLTFCNAGRLETLDCTALGFTGCDVNEDVSHYGCIPILSF